jgi:hypothetical protein
VALKDPKMSKQCTAGKRKHVTLTVFQKLAYIGRLLIVAKAEEFMSSHNFGLSTVHDIKKWKDHL